MTHVSANNYHAASYDWFADDPLEISDFKEQTFEFAGTKYHVIDHDIIGRQDFTKFTGDTEKIVQQLVPIFAGRCRNFGPAGAVQGILVYFPRLAESRRRPRASQFHADQFLEGLGQHRAGRRVPHAIRAEAVRHLTRILSCLEREAHSAAAARPVRLFAPGAHSFALDFGRPDELLRRAWTSSALV